MTTHQNSMEVGMTILRQLGGSRFVAMTGAKCFLAGKDYLQFEVPANLTKQKINKVKVTLTPDDTYTVTFLKWNRAKLEMTTMATRENVYVDNLREVFTSETGLETSL